MPGLGGDVLTKLGANVTQNNTYDIFDADTIEGSSVTDTFFIAVTDNSTVVTVDGEGGEDRINLIDASITSVTRNLDGDLIDINVVNGQYALKYSQLSELGDFITGFDSGQDKFEFNETIFGGTAGQTLAGNAFEAGVDKTAASNANIRFFFNQTTDELFFDADGSTATEDAVLVADMTGSDDIVAGDITFIA